MPDFETVSNSQFLSDVQKMTTVIELDQSLTKEFDKVDMNLATQETLINQFKAVSEKKIQEVYTAMQDDLMLVMEEQKLME